MGKRTREAGSSSSHKKPNSVKQKPVYAKKNYKSSVPASLYSTGSKAELKSTDVAPVQKELTNTVFFTLLNPTQEGSSFYNRIGRKISMKSLMIQGFLSPHSGATGGVEDYARFLVVYDRQPNGALPTLADVLTSYDNQGSTTSGVLDQVNMNNRERFKVLMDERLILVPSGGATSNIIEELNGTGQQQTMNIKRFFKLNRLVTQYKASSNPAIIGDIATGSLFLMAVTRNNATTQGTWDFTMQSRLRYWDN